jgi:hypothetical protein
MRSWLRLCSMVVCAAAAWALPAHADPGRAPSILCYVWANNPTQAFNVPYSPSGTYSYNFIGRDAANIVTRTATGTYVVTCKGVGGGNVAGAPATAAAAADEESAALSTDEKAALEEAGEKIDKVNSWGPGGHVQVTAYGGEDADHCKVLNWATGGADFTANVKCYNYKGKAADSRFDLLFVW